MKVKMKFNRRFKVFMEIFICEIPRGLGEDVISCK